MPLRGLNSYHFSQAFNLEVPRIATENKTTIFSGTALWSPIVASIATVTRRTRLRSDDPHCEIGCMECRVRCGTLNVRVIIGR